MKNVFITTFICFNFTYFLNAQTICGAKDSFYTPIEQIVYFQANDSINSVVDSYNLDSIESSLNNTLHFKKGNYSGGPDIEALHVPIKVWVIKGPNGEYQGDIFGRVNVLIRELNVLGKNLQEKLGITYYLEDLELVSNITGLYEIDEDEYYDDNVIKQLEDANHKKGCINIYLVNDITAGIPKGQTNLTVGAFARYPNGKQDYCLVIPQDQMLSTTLLHEIGHTFNLRHTHGTSNTSPNEDWGFCKMEASSNTRTIRHDKGCAWRFEGKKTSAVNGDFITDTYGSPMCRRPNGVPGTNLGNSTFDVNGDGVPDQNNKFFYDVYGDPWKDEVFQYVMGYGNGESIITKNQRNVMKHQIVSGNYGKKIPTEPNKITNHRLNHDNIGLDLFGQMNQYREM